MTEEQYAIAWMQLAKEERKRAMQRDGKLQFLKQNMLMSRQKNLIQRLGTRFFLESEK